MVTDLRVHTVTNWIDGVLAARAEGTVDGVRVATFLSLQDADDRAYVEGLLTAVAVRSREARARQALRVLVDRVERTRHTNARHDRDAVRRAAAALRGRP